MMLQCYSDSKMQNPSGASQECYEAPKRGGWSGISPLRLDATDVEEAVGRPPEAVDGDVDVGTQVLQVEVGSDELLHSTDDLGGLLLGEGSLGELDGDPDIRDIDVLTMGLLVADLDAGLGRALVEVEPCGILDEEPGKGATEVTDLALQDGPLVIAGAGVVLGLGGDLDEGHFRDLLGAQSACSD